MIYRLQRIVQEVDHAADIDAALIVLAEGLIRDLDIGVCSIYLVREDDPQVLVLKASSGLNPAVVGKVELRFGQGIVGTVAERSEAMNILNAPEHEKFELVPESGETEFPIFLGVPIITHGDVLGVIAVQRAVNAFTEDEEAYLTTLAAQLAASIERVESQSQLVKETATHVLRGVAGAPGMSIGEAVVLNRGVDLVSVPDRICSNIDADLAAFREAVGMVCDELTEQAEKMRISLSEEEAALFVAYAQMLSGGSLIEDTEKRILAGNWAQSSWSDTVEEHAYVFEQMEDRYLAERANDIRDLGLRVLRKLIAGQIQVPEFPKNGILVGDEVSAIDLADVPLDRLVGIVSAHGSSSSHVAILAHALGIPAVMGVPGLPLKQLDGIKLIVDGFGGLAFANPDRRILDEYEKYIDEEAAIDQDLLELKNLPAATVDKHPVRLLVNTGLMTDYTPSLHSGAEGVGLYRTEIPFQMRDRFPTEEEQYEIYRGVLTAFEGMPVVLRTLDVGGDKPLTYFPINEANPFLGWRGIRVTLDHPEIFITQVRAMIRANVGINNLDILLPMISGRDDFEASLDLITRAHREIEEELGTKIPLPRIGAMIEVPSAIYQIEDICALAEFVSIGTNDLTQYLLAVDRNNENVADLYSSLHPAMLKAMCQIVQGVSRSRTPLSVCGELAGDPLGIMALLGMGIDTLSMSVGSLLRAKKVIVSFSMSELGDLLDQAIRLPSAGAVLEFYAGKLEERGLGGLIRAGG
ncbi:MAG: phosphoenolpyruvate--protein phosphotransferase [Gammaproteobacteria bacterium]|nr:MAG: phosphoenolpyruvate--protein phosphotransferase [Gammaproteobacteria bacterium]UCH38707.1 MAG: phosphoenolpyruvate--protein phosphotransferase [Gammaproteobacteria bacterium]